MCIPEGAYTIISTAEGASDVVLTDADGPGPILEPKSSDDTETKWTIQLATQGCLIHNGTGGYLVPNSQKTLVVYSDTPGTCVWDINIVSNTPNTYLINLGGTQLYWGPMGNSLNLRNRRKMTDISGGLGWAIA